MVLVVDDDPLLREALGRLLRSVGFRVELFESAPDCCRLSFLTLRAVSCSTSGCQNAAGSIFSTSSPMRISRSRLSSLRPTVTFRCRAMKAGAVDFLTKSFRDQDLLDAVGIALERDRKRRDEATRREEIKALFETLTPRERQIMALVAAGLMNEQIAAETGISEITVKIHRGHVMRKMNARSLAELVLMAEALGMVARDRPQSKT